MTRVLNAATAGLLTLLLCYFSYHSALAHALLCFAAGVGIGFLVAELRAYVEHNL